jgi:carboxyl-terminal processing protease
MQNMKHFLTLICLPMVIGLAVSCKKTEAGTDNPTGPVDNASKLDLLRDSVYYYSKEIYLWHEVIPSYASFNPRQYTGSTELEAAQKVMAAIRNLQVQDKKHGYSFVTTQEESDGIQSGADKDYGFFIKAAAVDVVQPLDSIRWFVQYVYNASPSGVAGIERGWYISKINNTNIGYDNASVAILNDVFFGAGTSAKFTFVKPDGNAVDKDLAKASFIANSVLHTSVITNGAKKTGYLVFNQFLGAPSRTELTAAFNDFSSKGINELIVDLRYNRGGSTETQNLLANLIVPASATNQTMYTYVFNDSLTAGKFPLLKRKPGFSNVTFAPGPNTVLYSKQGTLNLNRVFFIVTGESASASELVINNLRPHMEVKLIGDTTYGKPVGFFPVSVFNYALYPISFKTVNSQGNAEYYDGFAPDKLTPDGVNKNWGDVSEPSFAAALRYINTGSFNRTINVEEENRRQLEKQKQLAPLNSVLSENKFTGMYSERK